MTVSFHLDGQEEITLLTSLLTQLQKAGVKFQVIYPDKQTIKDDKAEVKVETPVVKSPRLSDELHGIINLPEGFDYKSFLSEAVLSKHG